ARAEAVAWRWFIIVFIIVFTLSDARWVVCGPCSTLLSDAPCRGGGTGRRRGLKILRPQGLRGSTPLLGTLHPRAHASAAGFQYSRQTAIRPPPTPATPMRRHPTRP